MSGGVARDAVRAHFDATADYWSDVYDVRGGVAGQVYRERLARTLEYVDALGLPPGTRAVDVGAGAGVAATALAARSFAVTAVDSSDRMLELAAERARRAGVEIELVKGDASAIPMAEASQDLIVALGLLPWLEDARPVLAEFQRLLRPGGSLIVTADNRWRLTELLDPSLTPVAAGLRRRVAARRRARRGRPEPPFEVRRHTIDGLRELLISAGFEPVAGSTVGYGPFTFLRRPVLRGRVGIWIDRALTRRGTGSRLLDRRGVHVVVCAAKNARG
jgi:SAM-dependent methyltransferase